MSFIQMGTSTRFHSWIGHLWETSCHQDGVLIFWWTTDLKQFLKGYGNTLRKLHTKKKLLGHSIDEPWRKIKKMTNFKYIDIKAWPLVYSRGLPAGWHLATSREKFDCCVLKDIIDIKWVEARYATQHPIDHRMAPLPRTLWPQIAPR